MIGCDPVFFNKNAQWLYLVQHADHAFAYRGTGAGCGPALRCRRRQATLQCGVRSNIEHSHREPV